MHPNIVMSRADSGVPSVTARQTTNRCGGCRWTVTSSQSDYWATKAKQSPMKCDRPVLSVSSLLLLRLAAMCKQHRTPTLAIILITSLSTVQFHLALAIDVNSTNTTTSTTTSSSTTVALAPTPPITPTTLPNSSRAEVDQHPTTSTVSPAKTVTGQADIHYNSSSSSSSNRSFELPPVSLNASLDKATSVSSSNFNQSIIRDVSSSVWLRAPLNVSNISLSTVNTTITATTSSSRSSQNGAQLTNDINQKNKEDRTDDDDSVVQSDLLAQLNCEYGSVRQYSVDYVVQSRFAREINVRATILTKCLNQITWGFDELQDKPNGQKYLAYISEFRTDSDKSDTSRQIPLHALLRSKRSVYRYFENIWNGFKNMWAEDEENRIRSDEFDEDMLNSMESELVIKCQLLPKYWDSQKYYQYSGIDKCVNCNSNVLSKILLPFWFIQLKDGSIPQVRFTKQETNLDVKNLKKFIVSLFVTQLNASNLNVAEKTCIGAHNSHYSTVNHNGSLPDISTGTIQLHKHINTSDLIFHNNELDYTARTYRTYTELNQSQTIDIHNNLIAETIGTTQEQFGPNNLKEFMLSKGEYRLKKEDTYKQKYGDFLNVLNERYRELTSETLVATNKKKLAVMWEKYLNLLSRLRNKLGRNEYRYYTNLYEHATSSLKSSEHDLLLELVRLEQQFNQTTHQHNSIIGDLRRIGTVHNIQLVCGQSFSTMESTKCMSFIYLLLKSNSKVIQRDLLTIIQSHNVSELKSAECARMLALVSEPTRWLIEKLVYEAHRYTSDRFLETKLLQTLTSLAKNGQFVKLRELLSVHIVKRIHDISREQKSPKLELYVIDLIKMIGNINNYTAIESVHKVLREQWPDSIYITIATIQAYRQSINRSQVQKQLGNLFADSNSCQIKQEIVHLLIDNVDLTVSKQTEDKDWPKYGFNQLDQILLQSLRNPSDNCVHYLTVQYFKRKVNAKAQKYVSDFQATQHLNSSSFDFCKNESLYVKCDYVQNTGTDMASMSVQKSIVVSKSWLVSDSASNDSLGKNMVVSAHSVYTKYSIHAELLKHRLTIGHLNVIQSKGAQTSQFRIELDTHDGQSIPIANFSANMSDSANVTEIAQTKIATPVMMAWTGRSLHFDSSLLIRATAAFAVELATTEQYCQQCNPNANNIPALQISMNIETTGELFTSSLTRRSNLKLTSKFEYQTNQPIELVSEPVPNKNSASVGLQSLGNEMFHHEIKLTSELNKNYDLQCNSWKEDTFGQILYHWNSTLSQNNVLSLPVEVKSGHEW